MSCNNIMKHIISLDSSQRDSIYTNNNKWKYRLTSTLQNIKKVKLIGAIIANTQYIINANNKTLVLTVAAVDHTFNLTEGNYTPSSLASHIQTVLNTNAFASTFTITDNTITNKFRFQSTVGCIYKWASNSSLARIFGFNASNTTTTTDITSTNCYLVSATRYYKIKIPEISNTIETNIQTNFYSFLIPNNCNSGEFNYLTKSNNINNVINTPQRDINFITIELYDEDNNRCELNGVDYTIMLQLEC